jgi:flagella basal body P-ring formation protein FlgA
VRNEHATSEDVIFLTLNTWKATRLVTNEDRSRVKNITEFKMNQKCNKSSRMILGEVGPELADNSPIYRK